MDFEYWMTIYFQCWFLSGPMCILVLELYWVAIFAVLPRKTAEVLGK